MSEKDLEISPNVRQTLEEMANTAGLSLERLEALLLEAFVEGDGKIAGVITSHDIMLLQGHSPYYLFKEIRSCRKMVELYPLAQKIPEVIRALIKEGAKAGNITQMIAILKTLSE